MVTNEEVAILLASISKQMTQQGQLIRKMWVEMTGLAPTADDLKPKIKMSTVGPGIIITQEGHAIERAKPETPVEEGFYYVDAIFERETEKAEMYSHPDDPKLITWVPKSVIKTYDNKLCKLTLISKYALDKYIKWVVKTS